MNFPVQATVEQFDMPRTCGACVPSIGNSRPPGVEGRADVPVLVFFENQEHGRVVPAALSPGLNFSLPDPCAVPA